MIINAGIDKIVYEEGYADTLAKTMLEESGMEVAKFDRERNSKTQNRKSKPPIRAGVKR